MSTSPKSHLKSAAEDVGADSSDSPKFRLTLSETCSSLLRLLPGHGHHITAGFLLLALGRVIALLQPLLWAHLLDTVLATRDLPRLWPVFALVAVAQISRAITARLGWDMVAFRFIRIESEVRERIHERLLAQGDEFHQRHRRGDLIDRSSRDLGKVVNSLRSLLLQHAMQTLQLVGALLLMASLDVRLTLAVMIPMAFACFALKWHVGRFEDRYRAHSEKWGRLSSMLSENLEALRVVRGLAREDDAHDDYRQLSHGHRDQGIRLSFENTIFWAGFQLAGISIQIGLLAAGCRMVVAGTMSIGQLLAVREYWGYLWFPLNEVLKSFDTLNTARASAERVLEVLQEPLTVAFPEGTEVDMGPRPYAVLFENVALQYPGGRQALNGVQFEIPAGKRVAVMGPNGSGKSTLVSLLLRARDPDAGSIRIGSVDLKDVPRIQFQGLFGPVEQDPVLFHRSLRENIALGRPEATEEEVHDAARRAGAHDFILELPKGYDTEVGERGARLSGGQRQRVCIARAFLADPQILILDEATASVEPEAEAHIDTALRQLMQGRTTVLVTHKVHLARSCDLVVVLEAGSVAHVGTFDEVERESVWLAEAATLQSGALPRSDAASL